MIVEGFDFASGVAEANRRARLMIESGLYSRFGLSENSRLAKAELGCIGEVAFEHWLKSQAIEYEVDNLVYENRNSDEFDFRINGRTIDIKVARLSTSNPPNDNWRFGVPQEQNPSSKDILVIGWVNYSTSEVGFYGWISGAQVADCRVVKENTLTGAAYLTPNHEFRWGDLNKDIQSIFRT